MYIKNRIENEVRELNDIVFRELYRLYTIFIEVEVKGLLPYLEIEYILEDTDKNTSFTSFLYAIEEKF